MPKTGKDDHAKDSEIPDTLERSDQKAQDTFAKAYDSAVEQYDDESRAVRIRPGLLGGGFRYQATTVLDGRHQPRTGNRDARTHREPGDAVAHGGDLAGTVGHRDA